MGWTVGKAVGTHRNRRNDGGNDQRQVANGRSIRHTCRITLRLWQHWISTPTIGQTLFQRHCGTTAGMCEIPLCSRKGRNPTSRRWWTTSVSFRRRRRRGNITGPLRHLWPRSSIYHRLLSLRILFNLERQLRWLRPRNNERRSRGGNNTSVWLSNQGCRRWQPRRRRRQSNG